MLAEVARLASATDRLLALVESVSAELNKLVPIDRATYFVSSDRFLTPSDCDICYDVCEEENLARVVITDSDTRVCEDSDKEWSGSCRAKFCFKVELWAGAEDRTQGWIHLSRNSKPFTQEERQIAVEFARHTSPAMDTALSHGAAIRLSEEQLRAERAEAEVKHQHKINEAKEAFIATMSHELRTPLASIRAFADLLNRDSKNELSDRRKQQVSVIRRNAEWLNILINDLLDLSSIDSGRFELQLKDVDLVEHLNAISESFVPIAGFSGHTLKTILSKRSVMMRFDPNRVNQVLGNLLTNAMKYSSEGSEIRLLTRPTHDGAWFYVRDHGPGIPKDQHKSVFERFVRAKSKASKKARGNGIGLYVSKMIVDGHNGKIGVSSVLDDHTTMYFWLPKEPVLVNMDADDDVVEAAD